MRDSFFFCKKKIKKNWTSPEKYNRVCYLILKYICNCFEVCRFTYDIFPLPYISLHSFLQTEINRFFLHKSTLKIRDILHKCDQFCLFPSGVQQNEGKWCRICHTCRRDPDLPYFFCKIWQLSFTDLRIEGKTCHFRDDSILMSNHSFILATTVTSNTSVHLLIGNLPMGDNFMRPCLLWKSSI